MRIYLFIFFLTIIKSLHSQTTEKPDSSFFPKAKGSIDINKPRYPKELDSLNNNIYQQKKITYLNERIANGKIPDINYKLVTLEGKVFYKNEMKDKIVVFHFFCCYGKHDKCQNDFWNKSEMPFLNELVKEFKNEDVLFFAFPANDDNKKELLIKFFKENPFYFNVVSENAQSIFTMYSVETFPKTIIFNEKGQVIAWTRGNKKEQIGYPIEKALIEKKTSKKLKNPSE